MCTLTHFSQVTLTMPCQLMGLRKGFRGLATRLDFRGSTLENAAEEEGREEASVAAGAWRTGFWETTAGFSSPRPMATFAHPQKPAWLETSVAFGGFHVV